MNKDPRRRDSDEPPQENDPDVPMPPDDPARGPPVEEPPNHKPPKRAVIRQFDYCMRSLDGAVVVEQIIHAAFSSLFLHQLRDVRIR
jgi:hypothetical protein